MRGTNRSQSFGPGGQGRERMTAGRQVKSQTDKQTGTKSQTDRYTQTNRQVQTDTYNRQPNMAGLVGMLMKMKQEVKNLPFLILTGWEPFIQSLV